MIKVLLAVCFGALLVFAAYEVAGAERPPPEGYVECGDGFITKAEFEPEDFAHLGDYAIAHHWVGEADPCGERWLMPAGMLRDNLWWIEQWTRWATRNDDFSLTVGIFTVAQGQAGEWACSGIAAGCAIVPSCGVGEVQILDGDAEIGLIDLITLIHELTHVILLDWERCRPEEDSFELHGKAFYTSYRWALLSLLDEDIGPYCIEHGMWCEGA